MYYVLQCISESEYMIDGSFEYRLKYINQQVSGILRFWVQDTYNRNISGCFDMDIFKE